MIYVSVTVDVDAIAGWLGSYGGQDSLCDLSRGEFAGKVGVPRLLNLMEKLGIKSTWFVPGHSLETFKEEITSVVEAKHELGTHGYSHENPLMLTKEKEEKILKKCVGLIEDLTGEKPKGNRQPWWDMAPWTIDNLEKLDFTYDSSLMGREFHPYFLRKGDRWFKIDYAKDPEEWMKPYEFGEKTKIIEFPISWYLDDLPPQMFMKHPYYNYGWTHPDVVYDVMFKEHFDYLYSEEGNGILVLTIHPDVSGRVQSINRLKKLLEYIKTRGSNFVTLSEASSLFMEGKIK
ncbi:polysaccharide deacetylase [Acidianus sp. RZ1]|uniref:polysaccharide deacetylase family protein n=1 Tax=Acidianus sp. RZ1 TaxID=1540082 RepID=UPI0014920B90|nr:polysaccharide deacetylase [Acidianus sp. RZ1]NON61333.1 polysaccharide deacetylase [Acidianus sp. RZ1]